MPENGAPPTEDQGRNSTQHGIRRIGNVQNTGRISNDARQKN